MDCTPVHVEIYIPSSLSIDGLIMPAVSLRIGLPFSFAVTPGVVNVPFDPIALEKLLAKLLTLEADVASTTKPPLEPSLVARARAALANIVPELSTGGMSGAYFLHDEHGHRIAVFKPSDEEYGAENAPKRRASTPLLPPGGGAQREVAAFRLDTSVVGFEDCRAGVPATYWADDFHHAVFVGGETVSKSGSLQAYVHNEGESHVMSSSRFSVDDVHRIGVLDMRLLNMDRNGENLLVQRNGDAFRLVPIDHAYTLPADLGQAYFEWLHWKQAKVPFTPRMLSYIAAIDIDADARLLRSLGLDEAAVRTMTLSTALLKAGATRGMTLFEIASLASRASFDEPCALELLPRDLCSNGRSVDELLAVITAAINDLPTTNAA